MFSVMGTIRDEVKFLTEKCKDDMIARCDQFEMAWTG